jgi:hypothetical protein
VKRFPYIIVLALTSLMLGACEKDILDVDVPLTPRSYAADFGPSMGDIPTVTCTAEAAGVCGALPVVDLASMNDGPADVSIAVGCDAAKGQCFAQADATIGYEVNVLTDDAFVTKVERRATTFVIMVDIGYTLPTNTLTVDVPQIDVYVGPSGTRSAMDLNAVHVDSIAAIRAGETFEDQRHLTLGEGTPARVFLDQTIAAQEPFVLLVTTSPRLEAGAPMPAGGFQIVLYPTVRVGMPR